MGLFDKKYCDICGEEIGLLGNRKPDAAIYGDRTEWIQKADAALAAFNG